MDWGVFRGDGVPHDVELPEAPPWRRFGEVMLSRGAMYKSHPTEVKMVNAAIYLRRPLLVTGRPGSGKSSLAHAIVHELKLEPVLRWPITSRTTLADGLYRYDAIGRLQEAGLRDKHDPPDIGSYLRLGPLGTALATQKGSKPRVLLIDEIDKSDVDLPNDLLHVFEEGSFTIPEIERLDPAQARLARVRPIDAGPDLPVPDGKVVCEEFPIVIFTSNGERDFPPAFLRRCLRLELAPPDVPHLTRVVEAHLGHEALTNESRALINQFVDRTNAGELLATDQLLNAIFLLTRGQLPEGAWPQLERDVLRSLSNQ